MPFELYGGDPNFSPLPVIEQKKMFTPGKNPFFRTAQVRFFLLRDGGKTLGRVASIVNHAHLKYHDDRAGFFGFYESVNDPAAARLLLEAAASELKKSGLSVMRGPMNFSTNEECGFLLENFKDPPMLMTPYNPPYYNELMAACGMAKSKDLLAYIRDMALPLPEKVERVAAIAERKGVTARLLEKKNLHSELTVFKDVYNSSWKDNWGFIPITVEEVDDMAKKLKGVLVPELTIIAQAGEKPVGFLGIVPDFNHVLRKMGGRIGPVSILKALYHSGKIDSLRLMLLGVDSGWRNRGVEALMIREGFKGIKGFGNKYKRIEFSWILEDNLPIIYISQMIGGEVYKRYRIYERAL
ncbi:MAG: hypothetical protein M0Z59_09950 [Nitrospiraceae bacterium]|nr:hypothetical protein [Nitrospiraceae bacterium]